MITKRYKVENVVMNLKVITNLILISRHTFLTYHFGSKLTVIVSYMAILAHLFTYTVLTSYTVIVNYFVNVFNYTTICPHHLYHQHTKMSAADPQEVFNFICSSNSSVSHHFKIHNILSIFSNVLFTWNLLSKW